MRYLTSFVLAVFIYIGVCSLQSGRRAPAPAPAPEVVPAVIMIPAPEQIPQETPPDESEEPVVEPVMPEPDTELPTVEAFALRPTYSPRRVRDSKDRPPVPDERRAAEPEKTESAPDPITDEALDPVPDVGPDPEPAEFADETVPADETERPDEEPSTEEVPTKQQPEESEEPSVDDNGEEEADQAQAEESIEEPEPDDDEEVGDWTISDLPISVDVDLPDNLAQLPDLVIRPPASDSAWKRIDSRMGIVTIAYPIDVPNPDVFLIWDLDGKARKVEKLNRAGFSNRCRDRSHVDHFKRKLLKGKRQFGIRRPMRIVGLVPAETDRRFAIAQTLAILAAGREPNEVALTWAHYDTQGKTSTGIVVDDVILTPGASKRKTTGR